MKIESAKTTEKEFVRTVTTTEKLTFRVECFSVELNDWLLDKTFSDLEKAQTRVADLKKWENWKSISKIRIVKRFEQIFDTVWEETDLL